MAPAEAVERKCLEARVALGVGKAQCPLGVLKRLPAAPLLVEYEGHVVMGVRLAEQIAELLRQLDGTPAVTTGVVKSAHLGVADSKIAAHPCLVGAVAQPDGRVQRALMCVDPVVPTPLPVQKQHERPRQL